MGLDVVIRGNIGVIKGQGKEHRNYHVGCRP